MKLRFEKDGLLKAVHILQGVVQSRSTIPILSNILISAQEERIEMSATDLEIGIRILVDGEILEPGTITVPARKIAEIVRELPQSTVKFSTIANDRIEIEYEGGMCTIIGLDAYEFPKMLTMPEKYLTVDASAFLEMLAKTSFAAASKDDGRHHLQGVYLHLTPDGTEVVATDGGRLAIVKSPPCESVSEENGFIVPLKAIGEIRKTFDDSEYLKIGFEENQLIFSDDRSTLVSRLIEGEFPRYEAIIPMNNDMRIILDTEKLLAVVKRVSILADPKTLLVRFNIQDGILSLSARSLDFGEARDELEIKNGDSNIQIGFNAKFVMDALSHIDSEEVAFIFKDPLSTAIIQPVDDVDCTYVLMPMRLD